MSVIGGPCAPPTRVTLHLQVKRLVDSAQIYLAWDWNPDGWRYVFDVDNSWRKNRFPNPDGPSKKEEAKSASRS